MVNLDLTTAGIALWTDGMDGCQRQKQYKLLFQLYLC